MLPARPAVHVTNLVVYAVSDHVWNNGNGILLPKKFVLNIKNYMTT
jgi:hypothetical protein